jgi:hypothetical protein
MELEIIMLSETNQTQKAKYHMFMESRPKMMMIVVVVMVMKIMGHECERGMVWGVIHERGRGKDTEGDEDLNMLHVCLKKA